MWLLQAALIRAPQGGFLLPYCPLPVACKGVLSLPCYGSSSGLAHGAPLPPQTLPPSPLPLAHSAPATAASLMVPAPFTPPPLAHVSGSPRACPESSPSLDTPPSYFLFFFKVLVLTSRYVNVLIALTFYCNRHGKAVKKGTLGCVWRGGERGVQTMAEGAELGGSDPQGCSVSLSDPTVVLIAKEGDYNRSHARARH